MNNNISNLLREFKRKHNCNDEFGIAILIVAIIFNLIGAVTPIIALNIVFQSISTTLVIYEIIRFFSKNLIKRRSENYWFLNLNSSIKNYFKDQKYYIKNAKTHKFFICPNCKQVCRVPKHKGKIKIKCPSCQNTFIKKT